MDRTVLITLKEISVKRYGGMEGWECGRKLPYAHTPTPNGSRMLLSLYSVLYTLYSASGGIKS